MKKIIALLLSLILILILSLAIPVSAVTPALRPPDLPEVPDISGSVHIELPEDYWETYFQDNPIIIKPISRPSRWRWLAQIYIN